MAQEQTIYSRRKGARARLEARYRAFLFWAKQRERGFMVVASVIIGVLGGLGAVAFRLGIDWVQELCWPEGEGTVERVAAASGYLRVIVPTAGGLLVGIIIQLFAKEAKGHGVPEVMEAVAVRGGVIRPRVSLAKLVASAVTIGSGGSAGREGPIIQIGSAIGSTVGQLLHVSSRRLKTFVACGAAAGMAATFNAPIAGALFAGEIILGNFGASMFGPIVISSVVGTAVSRQFLGNQPTFDIPVQYTLASPWELIPYAVLGVVAALVAQIFISLLSRTESGFDRLRIPDWIKPGIGGLLIGVAALWRPEAMGVGYDIMERAMAASGAESLVWMFLGILGLKLVATSLTLGSGGSGGIFAPSLLFGAMTGGAVGSVVAMLFPGAAPPGAYALVGMGAVVAAGTHAPITASVMMFELTGNYKIILPLLIACIISTLLAMAVRNESIYTIKLSARGRRLLFGREVNALRAIKVKQVMRVEDWETVRATTPLQELITLMVRSPQAYFYVASDEGTLAGVLSIHDLRRTLDDVENLAPILIAADVARADVVAVSQEDTLDVAMRLFGQELIEELPVVETARSRRVVGILRRGDVVAAYNREMFRRDMAGEVAGEMRSATEERIVEVAANFGLLEVEAPSEFVGETLQGLQLRPRHHVDLLLIRRPTSREGETEAIMPSAQTAIAHGDRLLLFGRKEALRPFRRL